MKNKKILILLVPCTLVLWGMIVFKIFSVVSPGNASGQVQTIVSVVNRSQELLADTFSIKANYRDPFLGKMYSSNSTVNISSDQENEKKVSTSKPVIASGILFPEIIYNGLIKNKQSNKQLILVQINGQSTIMKIGDIVNEVEITNVFNDSIEVKFQKEKRFIFK